MKPKFKDIYPALLIPFLVFLATILLIIVVSTIVVPWVRFGTPDLQFFFKLVLIVLFASFLGLGLGFLVLRFFTNRIRKQYKNIDERDMLLSAKASSVLGSLLLITPVFFAITLNLSDMTMDAQSALRYLNYVNLVLFIGARAPIKRFLVKFPLN